MLRDPKSVYDGAIGLSRGVNSGDLPSVIGQDQVSFAVNTTFRGGFAASRPGFQKVDLVWASNDALTADQTQVAFQDELFQGAAVYKPDTEFPLLVASVGGKIFTINLLSNEVRNIPAPDKDNSSILPQAWFCQAENFLVIQDNQSPALIFNGGGLTRSDPAGTGVPVGNVMAYGNGRLWVVRPNKVTFVAGDLVYSVSGRRQDVLGFTENTFLNEGGAFGVPDSAGPITGMQFMAVPDTSLGQGPLHVTTANTVFTVNAPFDRDTWKNLTYPIQTVSQIGFGAVAHNSIVLVNGDMFYRAFDGFRSYIVAARAFGQWGNTPISRSMNRVFLRDTRHLLNAGSAVVYDNRMLATCIPQYVPQHGTIHKGIAALDFDNLGQFDNPQPPAWDGLWTGLNVLQLVKFDYNGEEYCYAFTLNALNQIELWELTRDRPFDNRTDRIKSIIEFRSMDFQQPGLLKELEQADIWVDRISGKVKFSVKYRPDQYPCWTSWGDDREVCANFEDCDTADGTCISATNYQEQMRSRIGFGSPTDEFLASDLKKMRTGYEFQPRLEVDGPYRLRGLRLKARETAEFPFADLEK